ncbi:MAG: PQQ-dependent sugar dehydrogenase [Armatimonadota bacterium]
MPLRPTQLCVVSLLAAGAVFAQAEMDYPGRQHYINPAVLPAPFATPSAGNGPILVPRPEGELPDVPAGFRVNVFAENLGGNNSPRRLAVAPNGDVFVADSGGDRVLALRDQDGDGVAETMAVFADRRQKLSRPFGLAFRGKWLYVANSTSVVRLPYQAGRLSASGKPKVLIKKIPGFGHWTRDILFSADGKKLFLAIGSESNNSPEQPVRAAIHAYKPNGKKLGRYAWGLRNPAGLALNPTDGALWTVVNERDGYGDDLVPDFFTEVKSGGFYGWPYYYIGTNRDPGVVREPKEPAKSVIVPDVLLQSHSAPLGCTFYTGSQFPAEYRNDAFVAMHGSWNRSLRTGYKVVRVRFQHGKPVGGYEDFMTGFLTDPASRNVWGRPVDVAVAADGALLVSDDGGHRIWRVSYVGK